MHGGLAPIDQADVDQWLAVRVSQGGIEHADIESGRGIVAVDLHVASRRNSESTGPAKFTFCVALPIEAGEGINIRPDTDGKIPKGLERDRWADGYELERRRRGGRGKGAVFRPSRERSHRAEDREADDRCVEKLKTKILEIRRYIEIGRRRDGHRARQIAMSGLTGCIAEVDPPADKSGPQRELHAAQLRHAGGVVIAGGGVVRLGDECRRLPGGRSALIVNAETAGMAVRREYQQHNDSERRDRVQEVGSAVVKEVTRLHQGCMVFPTAPTGDGLSETAEPAPSIGCAHLCHCA